MLSAKDVFDRLCSLMENEEEIKADIKQLKADAKEQGLDADAIAKVAAGKVKDSLKAKAKAYRRMRDAAREVGCDQLELDYAGDDDVRETF